MPQETEYSREPNVSLRQQRELRGWSRQRLATEIRQRYPGAAVTEKEIARWEWGKRKPGPYYQEKLCAIFEMTAEDLGFLSQKGTSPLSERVDWGEAPLALQFYGRDQERARLQRWICDEHCSIVAILGMGGVGKSSLGVSVTERLKDAFSFVFWRSLQNAPALDLVLRDCIHFLSGRHTIEDVQDVEKQISELVALLQKHRCLLVLDNVETILQGGDCVGFYRSGYEGYGKLLRRLGEGSHQSCLLLTSREKPQEIALLEGGTALVRSYQLSGLNLVDGRAMLQDKGVHGEEAAWKEFIYHYDGNPLSLKLAAQYIQEVFQGDIARFLEEGEMLVNDVRMVLDQQFDRLSPLEQAVMYWLAIEREAISLKDLERDLLHPVPKRQLQAALLSLHQRYLTETQMGGVTLHNVIMEYVTNRFIERLFEELQTGQLFLFEQHALIMAQARDYVRESQIRLILKPLVQQLSSVLQWDEIEHLLRTLLARLRTKRSLQLGYAAGNILNLFIQSGYNVRGYDFSHLPVRQAYLQGATLPEVRFVSADLTTSVFTDTFGSVLSVALSADSLLVAAGTTNGEVRIWNASGKPLNTCLGHTDWVRSVAFSPDGRKVASGSHDQTIRLWDAETGQCLHVLRDHTNRVRSVVFHPDGKKVASGCEDQTIRLWDAETGQCLSVLQGHVGWLYTIAFSPDGRKLASGGEDQTVRLWNTVTGECLQVLQGHTGSLHAVAFSPDGSLVASGGEDQAIRLWDVETGQCLHMLQGHTHWIYTMAFSPDGEILASGAEDHIIRLWSVRGGQLLGLFSGHSSRVRSVAFSSDGATMVSGSEDQTIRFWDVKRSQCLKVLQGHRNWVRAVAFSSDGSMVASGGDDQIIRLWSVNNGRCVRTLRGRTDRMYTITFSPNGEMIAAGGEDLNLYVWDARSGWSLRLLQGHTGWIHSVAFSSNGQFLVSGGNDQIICLWDAKSGQCLKIMKGHTNRIRSVAFSPQGDLVASGSEDQDVRLWDSRSGQCLHILQGHTNRVWSVSFNSDGKRLVSAGHDHTARLWEVETGTCLQIFSGHTHRIWSVAFSSDGRTVATGSEDMTIRLWEVSSGRCLQVLQGHVGWIWSVAFSPNGSVLASGSDDGTIKLWDVQKGSMLSTLRDELPYERMDITDVRGMAESQKAVLKTLGAIEASSK